MNTPIQLSNYDSTLFMTIYDNNYLPILFKPQKVTQITKSDISETNSSFQVTTEYNTNFPQTGFSIEGPLNVIHENYYLYYSIDSIYHLLVN